ncbi:MAG: ATP-binding protein [Candidatus Hodarchaeales archaeon]|jgi:SpoVK/Ycf46/Vps4 family AAA+-type ATPase
MRNNDQFEYIKKYRPTKSVLKEDISTGEELLLEKLVPEIRSVSKEIRSYQFGLRKWWRKMFGNNKGLIFLFEESTGTGKTLSASILNEELKIDLYRIDLASITNKYIGETEKNLNQFLAKAESEDVVLFFDEADSLFGKRTDVTDAHDRISNQKTNFLLEQIKRYKGVVILATNSKHRLDTAFSRRIRRVINFSILKDDEEE